MAKSSPSQDATGNHPASRPTDRWAYGSIGTTVTVTTPPKADGAGEVHHECVVVERTSGRIWARSPLGQVESYTLRRSAQPGVFYLSGTEPGGLRERIYRPGARSAAEA